ncbi:hypothetical protein SNL152K_10682 [Streptomyces sp. NL15-2K]|nr:hypothetical protein SNL152K_10682 [Streptomyces sp. NL15-2K]
MRALADRLMELLDDPAARRRMGEADRRSSPATTSTVRWPQSRPSTSMPPVTPRP